MKRIVLLTLPLLAACGPRYGMRVPDSMEKKLPYEARIELLEAENDLALSIDKVDVADNEIGRARDNIRRARSRQDAAEDEVDRATDEVPREVAKLAIAGKEILYGLVTHFQPLEMDDAQILLALLPDLILL